MRINLDIKKVISLSVFFAFLVNTFGPVPVYAQDMLLPVPGNMVHLSPAFNPPILKGIKVHPENPFRFDFILDKGDFVETPLMASLQDESKKLIKYFLASLTIPEKDLWVNLSPYEKDRIIPNSFGLTEMGRDLLAEDYMLKQITASLIYPEDETGKRFWKRIYEEAAKKFGMTNVPVNTFNKVWIVPEKAVVYENAKAGTAYVVEAKLKVMLDQDYVALQHSRSAEPIEALALQKQLPLPTNINILGSKILREIVIPQLTAEVNKNKNFATLRQVYNSLILAYWYKKKIKDSILAQVYEAKNKVTGITIDDPQEKEKIYERYLRAFKKGVYNYIKEEQDPQTKEMLPRKYFSGGTTLDDAAMASAIEYSQKLPGDQNGGLKEIKAGLVIPHATGSGKSLARAMDQFKKEIEYGLGKKGYGKNLSNKTTPALTVDGVLKQWEGYLLGNQPPHVDWKRQIKFEGKAFDLSLIQKGGETRLGIEIISKDGNEGKVYKGLGVIVGSEDHLKGYRQAMKDLRAKIIERGAKGDRAMSAQQKIVSKPDAAMVNDLPFAWDYVAEVRLDQAMMAKDQAIETLIAMRSRPYFVTTRKEEYYSKYVIQVIKVMRALRELMETPVHERTKIMPVLINRYHLLPLWGRDFMRKKPLINLANQVEEVYSGEEGFGLEDFSSVCDAVSEFYPKFAGIKADFDIQHEIASYGAVPIKKQLNEELKETTAYLDEIIFNKSDFSTIYDELDRRFKVPSRIWTVLLLLKWCANLAESNESPDQQKRAKEFLAYFTKRYLKENKDILDGFADFVFGKVAEAQNKGHYTEGDGSVKVVVMLTGAEQLGNWLVARAKALNKKVVFKKLMLTINMIYNFVGELHEFIDLKQALKDKLQSYLSENGLSREETKHAVFIDTGFVGSIYQLLYQRSNTGDDFLLLIQSGAKSGSNAGAPVIGFNHTNGWGSMEQVRRLAKLAYVMDDGFEASTTSSRSFNSTVAPTPRPWFHDLVARELEKLTNETTTGGDRLSPTGIDRAMASQTANRNIKTEGSLPPYEKILGSDPRTPLEIFLDQRIPGEGRTYREKYTKETLLALQRFIRYPSGQSISTPARDVVDLNIFLADAFLEAHFHYDRDAFLREDIDGMVPQLRPILVDILGFADEAYRQNNKTQGARIFLWKLGKIAFNRSFMDYPDDYNQNFPLGGFISDDKNDYILDLAAGPRAALYLKRMKDEKMILVDISYFVEGFLNEAKKYFHIGDNVIVRRADVREVSAYLTEPQYRHIRLCNINTYVGSLNPAIYREFVNKIAPGGTISVEYYNDFPSEAAVFVHGASSITQQRNMWYVMDGVMEDLSSEQIRYSLFRNVVQIRHIDELKELIGDEHVMRGIDISQSHNKFSQFAVHTGQRIIGLILADRKHGSSIVSIQKLRVHAEDAEDRELIMAGLLVNLIREALKDENITSISVGLGKNKSLIGFFEKFGFSENKSSVGDYRLLRSSFQRVLEQGRHDRAMTVIGDKQKRVRKSMAQYFGNLNRLSNNEESIKGGIDLTPNKFLQVKNLGVGIKFHLDPVQLAQLKNAPGFVPVIINIQPLVNLREFLGVLS